MNEFSMWLGWLCNEVAWLPIAWLAIALLIGIPWIISDELRINRTAPKAAEVNTYADKMEAEHGTEATMAVGQAMYDALERKDFASRRFLKAVSIELAQRMVGREGPHKIQHRLKNSMTP
jgi:ribosomal protein L17